MKDGSESSDSTFVFDEFVASAPPNDESVQIEAQDSLAPSDEHSTVSMSESSSDFLFAYFCPFFSCVSVYLTELFHCYFSSSLPF